MAEDTSPNLSLSRRAAGILLHPTSLPGRHGSGDLGLPAREFATFLHQAGQSWWQMLPIHPIGPGNSPYSALSAFAGNPLLISLERLADDGLLDRRDVAPARGLHTDRVNYPSVIRYRNSRLRRAYDAFRSAGGLRRKAFERFCATHADWLDDHALFMALRAANGGRPWLRWPRGVRLRQGRALTGARKDLADEIDLERFVQYVFDQQWTVLHEHARALGVGLIGDIPIFVAHDSSDVWARRELFDLAADGRAKTVSGVPPDCFSRTGQRLGAPAVPLVDGTSQTRLRVVAGPLRRARWSSSTPRASITSWASIACGRCSGTREDRPAWAAGSSTPGRAPASDASYASVFGAQLHDHRGGSRRR
jgi:4-alpha-glucanotransferase